MKTTKTFDGQTAKFIASIATCMPPLSGEDMQFLIDNPLRLKGVLLNLKAEAMDQVLAPNGMFYVHAMTPLHDGAIITILDSKETWQYGDGVSAVLGLDGKKRHTRDIVSIGNLLIKRGYTMTWEQAVEMADQYELYGNNGLLANGEDNLFFLETDNPASPVSVGNIYHGREWYRGREGLPLNDESRSNGSLMVRNLNLSL